VHLWFRSAAATGLAATTDSKAFMTLIRIWSETFSYLFGGLFSFVASFVAGILATN
jgi:hypothetical protein